MNRSRSRTGRSFRAGLPLPCEIGGRRAQRFWKLSPSGVLLFGLFAQPAAERVGQLAADRVVVAGEDAAPHRPILGPGFDSLLSTVMGGAMLVTVMAVRG